MSRREQLASEAGGELDPKLAGARDPYNASLWHASVFRVLWHLDGMLEFQNWARDYRKQHLALKKGPPLVN